MNRLVILLLTSVLALAQADGAIVQLSVASTPDPVPAPWARPGSVVQIGFDYTLRAGKHAEEVVVISGNAMISGEVGGDVVVMLGTLSLAGTAMVGGDVVVVDGSLAVEAGAKVGGDLVVVGGSLDEPPKVSPAGKQVVLGAITGRKRFASVLPWVPRMFWKRSSK